MPAGSWDARADGDPAGPEPALVAGIGFAGLRLVSDTFVDGCRFRALVVVDDFTRECLTLLVDTSLSGVRVARELDRLVALRGRPTMIVGDNGTEFTSNAILHWADQSRVEWHDIAPGKPMRDMPSSSRSIQLAVFGK